MKLFSFFTIFLMCFSQAVSADVIIDDFENSLSDGDGQTYLGAAFNSSVDTYYDAGFWFSYSTGSTTMSDPDFAKDGFVGNLSKIGANSGSGYLNVLASLDKTSGSYALGFNLTEAGLKTDCSKMGAIEFYAKGSGKFILKFATDASDKIGSWGDMVSTPIVLTSSWTKYSIDSTMIKPEVNSDDANQGLTWNTAKKAVHKITFYSTDTSGTINLSLDDVSMTGMEYDDFAWGTHKVNSQVSPNPIITVPTQPLYLVVGDAFNPATDIPYSAFDDEDGNLKPVVKITGIVNTSLVGSYKITFSVTDNDGYTSTESVTVIVREKVPVVIIDDFENSMKDPDNQSYLGARFNYYNNASDKYSSAGYWFAYDDGKSGTSSCVPDFAGKGFVGNLSSIGANSGAKYLKGKITLGKSIDGNNTAYYGIGFNLTQTGIYSDLSKMSSFEFYAKGIGDIYVKFKTKKTDDAGSWGDMVALVSLSTEWTKVVVNPDDIIPEPFSPGATQGITWNNAKSEVTQITFHAKQAPNTSLTMYLDDISLVNMEYKDFSWGEHHPNNGKLNGEGIPIAKDTTVTTVEDNNINIKLTAVDTDGVIVDYLLKDDPLNGLVTIKDSIATYIPDKNFFGIDSFTFVAEDNDGALTKIAKVKINVTSVNDQNPIVEDFSQTVNEDDSTKITFTAKDDGIVSFKVVENPVNGNIGNGIYVPNADFSGIDSLRFIAIDNDGTISDTAKVIITVKAVNDAPIISFVLDSIVEDTPGYVILKATDVDGVILEYSLESTPKKGKITLNGDSVLYVPDTNFFGLDSFIFKAKDNEKLGSKVGKAYVYVKSVNDGKPLLSSLSIRVSADTTSKRGLTTGDVNEYESVVGLQVVKDPMFGTATTEGVKVIYTPALVGAKRDTFYIVAVDNDGALSDTTAVSVFIDYSKLTISYEFQGKVVVVKEPLYGIVSITNSKLFYIPTTKEVKLDTLYIATVINDSTLADTTAIYVNIEEAKMGIDDYDLSSSLNEESLIVAPMPIKESAILIYDALESGVYEFTLYTTAKIQVLKQNCNLVSGKNKIPFAGVENLPGGIYYLLVTKDGADQALKIITKTK